MTFDTSESPFTPGEVNQGYYQRTEGRVINSNYIVGGLISEMGVLGSSWHNYFTFDLSSLDPTANIVSATLRVQRYSQQGGASELNLWDVTTDAQTLNTTASNDSAVYLPIYEDLGSGVSYGTFTVPTGLRTDILEFSLNSNAIAGIKAAAGQFFSIGGSLTLPALVQENQGTYLLFSGSDPSTQQLVLGLASVPEPASGVLLGMPLVSAVVFRLARRRRRLQAA